MANTAIQVENLSKSFVLKHQGDGGYRTLRDSIAQSFNKKNNTTTSIDQVSLLNDYENYTPHRNSKGKILK